MVGLSGWLGSESYKNWLSMSTEVFVPTGPGVEDLFRVGLYVLVWVGVPGAYPGFDVGGCFTG